MSLRDYFTPEVNKTSPKAVGVHASMLFVYDIEGQARFVMGWDEQQIASNVRRFKPIFKRRRPRLPTVDADAALAVKGQRRLTV